MHQLLLEHVGGLRSQPNEHELTVYTDKLVAKVVRCGTAPEELRNVETHGVHGWQHFHWLTPAEEAFVGLDPGPWLLAVRRFSPGTSLAESRPADPAAAALKVAHRVRDLHELGVVHGDLQPGNVVHDGGEVWLIDLSPVKKAPGERGYVAGSAALMAPELWEGEAATPAADVYALGCLTAWLLTGRYPFHGTDLASWAAAHRGGGPTLTGLDPQLQGVIARMLSADPLERPPIQALIDVLPDGEVPPVVARQFEVCDIAAIGRRVHAGHSVLTGRRRSGRTTALRRVASVCAASGRVVVGLRADQGTLGWLEASTGPWGAVDALLQALTWTTGEEHPRPTLGAGDRLWAFERLTAAVLDAVGTRPTTVLWDDFDRAGADVRAWWDHCRLAAEARDVPLSSVTVGEGEGWPRFELGAVEPSDWAKWRSATLRTEVRDISQARWSQLVAESGACVGAMLDALDAELGVTRGPQTRRREPLDTAALRSMQVGWRPRVEQLMEQCAYAEAIETASGLFRGLRSRGQADEDTSFELLETWTAAVVAGGGDGTAEQLREALETFEQARFRVQLARLLSAMGRHHEGLDALAEVRDTHLLGEVDGWRAQLALSSGDLDAAVEHARLGLSRVDVAAPVRQQLRMLADAPDALRGRAEALAALAELSGELERDAAPGLLRAKLHAYRAIGLTRNGDFDAAIDAHLAALEQIEAAGLAAEMPTYLLNVGTGYHRQGRLGLAREYYARGLRLCQPTTRASTQALLHANQANVDLALGRFAEARDLVQRGLSIAQREGLSNIAVMCRSVGADISLASGELDRARREYQDLLDSDEPRPSQRAELQLALSEISLLEADVQRATLHLAHARRLIDEHGLGDIDHLHGILRARLQWVEGGGVGTMAGIEIYRRNLLAAAAAGNHRLVLRHTGALLSALEREGLTELVEEVSQTAQSSRNAIATGLGRDLRRDFFANLAGLERSPADPVPTSPRRPERLPSGQEVEPFYRMLSLNEVILHADSLEGLLPDALEIAMSLSRAERGFILLRDDGAGRVGAFRVAASRDVDGASIPRPHLAVSLTIAEEAARTGRTVVTLNASEDQRFSEALSVVDLELTSVLCVPVRDATGLLGAIYLDHRFRPGVFEGEIPRMMEAFGHQLALGITNARRVSTLQQTQAELAELLKERDTMLAGLERRVATLATEVERADSGLRDAFPEIVHGSRQMERVLMMVKRVARGDVPVVVTGESGTGKELVARAIHDASPRSGGPFVAINCGAISENLFESELFGHRKGAFTGADTDRHGLFVAAEGGTIFLDEIGEMPLGMQVKLLRVLQERKVRRVGDSTLIPVDVRVVAATNRDLMQMSESGEFREDLYYRLAGLVISVPALRDRAEDIPLIARKLLERMAGELAGEWRLTADGARLLMHAQWPGNVRQLENTLRTAAVMSDREELDVEQLAPFVRVEGASARERSRTSKSGRGRRRKATRADVVDAMRRANDDRERAAELLEVSERTLYRYLKRWNLY